MTANGKNIYSHTPVSKDVAQKKIKEVTAAAGIPGADCFTTHCFCCGGAQYRFMYAPIGEHWTLARIQWWGGWATNEHHDTLIRYLLDELYNCEEDHSDALCPVKHDASMSHNGETQLLMSSFARSFTATNHWQAMVTPESTFQAFGHHMMTGLIPWMWFSHFPTIPSVIPMTVVTFQAPVPKSRWAIPNITKGLNGWKQIVKDWEFADPACSLNIALRDWTEEEIQASKLGSKYNHRQMIATEFIDEFHRDENAFLAAYPHKGLEELLLAVRMSWQQRSLIKTRRSKQD
ncbi:hypothetical protein C8J56DRAFT_1044894 [Mycena floridula]|nr:hypothetical protein C8J56DRAFT_1044894 [Mycena floridula]